MANLLLAHNRRLGSVEPRQPQRSGGNGGLRRRRDAFMAPLELGQRLYVNVTAARHRTSAGEETKEGVRFGQDEVPRAACRLEQQQHHHQQQQHDVHEPVPGDQTHLQQLPGNRSARRWENWCECSTEVDPVRSMTSAEARWSQWRDSGWSCFVIVIVIIVEMGYESLLLVCLFFLERYFWPVFFLLFYLFCWLWGFGHFSLEWGSDSFSIIWFVAFIRRFGSNKAILFWFLLITWQRLWLKHKAKFLLNKSTWLVSTIYELCSYISVQYPERIDLMAINIKCFYFISFIDTV